jgi:hypothetical protein
VQLIEAHLRYLGWFLVLPGASPPATIRTAKLWSPGLLYGDGLGHQTKRGMENSACAAAIRLGGVECLICSAEKLFPCLFARKANPTEAPSSITTDRHYDSVYQHWLKMSYAIQHLVRATLST